MNERAKTTGKNGKKSRSNSFCCKTAANYCALKGKGEERALSNVNGNCYRASSQGRGTVSKGIFNEFELCSESMIAARLLQSAALRRLEAERQPENKMILERYKRKEVANGRGVGEHNCHGRAFER